MRELLVLGLFLSLVASAQTPAPKLPLPQFKDVAKEAGLTVSHISTPEKKYIVESMSGGAGLIDCDNDGKLDIITVNGSTIDRFRQGGDPMITLYHQEADFKFSDITKIASLNRKGWGMGVAAADYDNDGLPDIYVTVYGGNALYHNLGYCKFEDVTDKAGVAAGGFSTGSAWADYDKDGHVDLFVARYVHFDMDKLPTFGSDEKNCRFKGILVQCGPWGMIGESDLLFHNRGDGTFEEVSKKAGVDDPNRYYGLGVDWGDYLHNGRLSMFVTNFTEQPSTLYRNLGKDGFSDVSGPTKLAQPTFPYVGWGTAFFDVDNDGWLDVFQANGHVYPQVDSIPGGPSYRQPMQLFRNNHDGTFEDVSRILSNIPAEGRRGAAFGDINNDGNIDIVMVNVGAPPTLLLNQSRNSNHRGLFKLIGTKSNRMAIGARVTVKAGKLTQFSEVRAGGSYLSSNDPRLHFGLGAEATMTEVEIRWPSGKIEVLNNIPADFIYTIIEGEGVKDRVALPALEPAPTRSPTARSQTPSAK